MNITYIGNRREALVVQINTEIKILVLIHCCIVCPLNKSIHEDTDNRYLQFVLIVLKKDATNKR